MQSVVVGFLAVCFAALAPPAPAGQCPLRIEPAELRLGSLRQGELQRFSFVITNSGAEAVEIAEVVADCACTDVRASARTLAAGGRVTVTGAVRRTDPGDFSARVLVKTTSPRCPLLTVPLSGKGRQSYLLSGGWAAATERPGARSMALSQLPDVQPEDASLTLWVQGLEADDPLLDDPALAEKVTLTSRLFELASAEVQSMSVAGENRLHLVLRLRPKAPLTPGRHQGHFALMLGKEIELRPYLAFRVLSDAWPSKQSVSFGAVRSGALEREVVIHFREGSKPWEAAELAAVTPESAGPALSIGGQERTPSGLRLTLSLDASKLPEGIVGKDGFFAFDVTIGPAGRADDDRAVTLMVFGLKP